MRSTSMQTRPDTEDKRTAVTYLSAYVARMEDLMTILSRGRSMTQMDRQSASEMYRTLKDDIKEDYRQLSRKSGRGETSDTEEAILLPAVHGASTRLRPATNTNPLNSNWLDAVYSAKIDIDHALDQLKD